MRFGYLLSTRNRSDLRPLLDEVRQAERLGFDSVWAGDSPIARPRPDALTILAAAAGVTERVSLGTAVLLPALRHPILLAQQLATVDQLSEGRLIAGMGAGFPIPATQTEFSAVGVTFERRVSRMVDSIHAMRRLWSEESVSFTSAHFDFHDITLIPRPARPGGPPIWLAGSGAPSLRRVAELADGWLPYPPAWQTYAQEVTMVGSATPGLYATLLLDEDPERGRERLRANIERYYNAPLEVIEGIQAMFAGPAKQARAWLDAYAAAGAEHVVVRLLDTSMEDFAEVTAA